MRMSVNAKVTSGGEPPSLSIYRDVNLICTQILLIYGEHNHNHHQVTLTQVVLSDFVQQGENFD